ncbi:MAG: TolC family protein [Candidatus Palauibacterales bacterium]|nr:TolC family protein [Candidatus Palauibacterales bacterium]
MTDEDGTGAETSRDRTRAATLSLAVAALTALAGAGEIHAQETTATDSVRRVSLEEATEIALRRSPSVEQARANLSSARSGVTGAVGSFLPSVNLGYGYSTASTGRLDPTGQAITRTSYSTQITSSVTLFDGMRRFHDLESSRKSAAAQRQTYQQQRYQALLQVKTAFYNAVAARRRVQVEQARVERLRNQLGFVRQQIALGQATRADSLSTRVDLNNAQVALLNARQNTRSARYTLGETMGLREPTAPAEAATLEPDSLDWGLDELVAVAREQAPSVRSARLQLQAAEADVSSAQSAYWPSFSLSGGFDWASEAFPPENRSWSVRVSGSLPLFNGLQRETSIDRAQAQLEVSRAQERAAELAVRTDVNDAYSQVETAVAQLDYARESVELARENLRVTRQRYRQGVATIVDLQQAQIALQQAQVDVIRRQFDYQVGVAQLESVIGSDLEELSPTPRQTSGAPNSIDEERP